jgi:hypothetical protein
MEFKSDLVAESRPTRMNDEGEKSVRKEDHNDFIKVVY